ncbi:MAG: hypothetical protein HN337_01575 [Deltaproteobacteria bacterium]|jgi:hypothetical protein|nr:hypothetical protein [Deltaproteobacteria bacterium]
MEYKVKVVESASPYDLEKYINQALADPEYKDFEVMDIKCVTTPMAGAKVSRGGIFYTASILFKKD